MPRQYSACLARVSGSKPPTPFLDELVDWALLAPDELFQPNAVFDVYSSVVGQLGPYGIGAHRKAVMLEVLRCLAGLESMWNWDQGVDGVKEVANNSHNEEAGAWQCSADSMANGQSLRDFVQDTLGATDDETFITGMKANHTFAIEYTVRLLRITINEWGPFVRSRSIFAQLNRASVKEFRSFLETIGDFPRPDPGMHYA